MGFNISFEIFFVSEPARPFVQTCKNCIYNSDMCQASFASQSYLYQPSLCDDKCNQTSGCNMAVYYPHKSKCFVYECPIVRQQFGHIALRRTYSSGKKIHECPSTISTRKGIPWKHCMHSRHENSILGFIESVHEE